MKFRILFLIYRLKSLACIISFINQWDDALGHQGKAPAKVPLFFHSLVGRNFTSADSVKPGGAWWEALERAFFGDGDDGDHGTADGGLGWTSDGY